MLAKTAFALVAALALATFAAASNLVEPAAAATNTRNLGLSGPGCNATYEGLPLCEWLRSSPSP